MEVDKGVAQMAQPEGADVPVGSHSNGHTIGFIVGFAVIAAWTICLLYGLWLTANPQIPSSSRDDAKRAAGTWVRSLMPNTYFLQDSAAATEMLEHPIANPATFDVNDALHMSGLTPLDAGDFPSTDPSARCYVRYGGTLTEIGSDDGRVLVRYDSPMFDSGDLRAVHDDPYGTNPPFSLPCFDGTVAFVQGADLFN